MRRALFLFPMLLVLAGCGEQAPAGPPPFPAEGDAVIVKQVLDGQLDADTALAKVAHSAGLPIRTSRGFLFVLRDQGLGPYTVESPSGAFASAPLTSSSGLAWALVPVPGPEGAEYRFLTGAAAPFSDPLSRQFAYAGAAQVSYVAAAATGPHLERWPLLGDAQLPPRTVRVRVPPQSPTHTLYVHDGQNLFGTSPLGGWGLQTAAGPTTLVVGIDNTSDRIAEYTPVQDDIGGGPIGGKGLAYADFVELTVRPFIEAHYGSTARRGVMGSSLGGLISYVVKRRYPASYDFAASLSGTFGWGSIGTGVHNQTEIQAWTALGACPTGTLYLDSGGGPGSGCTDSDSDGIDDDTPDASDNYCENVQLRDVLQALGCGSQVTYRWSSGAPHNEAAWRGRAPAILALFESL